MLQAEILKYKGERRIRLEYYDLDKKCDTQKLPLNILYKLKTIPYCHISNTLQSWNFPYDGDVKTKLENLFPDEEIIIINNEEKQKITSQPITKQNNIAIKKTNKSATLYIDKINKRFFVQHQNNKELWNKLREIEKGFWQKEKQQWIFSGDNDTYKIVCNTLTQHGYRIEKLVEPTMLEQETNPTVRSFIESLQMKNYSIHTIEAYLPHFKQFVSHFALYKPEELGYRQINQYITDTVQNNKFGDTQTRHLISAIKFFYEKILGKQKMYFNPPKKYEITNNAIVVQPDDLWHITSTIEDKKEVLYILLFLGYAKTPEQLATLTLHEIKEIIGTEIKQKTQLGQLLKSTITAYYKQYTPTSFLFENEMSEPISTTETEAILHKILQKHQITKLYELQYKTAAKQANFEYNTTKNYIGLFLSFLKHFAFRHPNQITNNEIKQYLLVCKNERKLSTSYINNLINSIKFYYTHIAKRKIDYRYLMRPKKEKKLPTVLSTGEVLRMIELTENIKHKNMIALLYASGLRRSELLNMKVKDIDFERNVVIIRGGKGKKDRQTPLAQNLLGVFKQYIDAHQPKDYLFEGAAGNKYSETSLEKVIKAAALRANIQKTVTPHTMRHTFATHLLENAVDIRYIQQLLGHSNIKTTERYTHVANTAQTIVVSPLDKLKLFNSDSEKDKPP